MLMSGQAFERFLPPTRQITDALQFLVGGIMLTQKRLKELLHYDPETGFFTRILRTSSKANVGDVAGCDDGCGYLRISIDRVAYLSHRLAWLYLTGVWPISEIDHKNGVRSCNRFNNLRESTRLLNQQNQRKAQRNNAIGFLGVIKVGKRFSAYIRHDGKKHYIGTYATPELAHDAYIEEKRKHHLGCTI